MAPSTAPVTLPPCSHGGLARLSGLGSPGRVSSPLRRSEPTWPWRLTRLALVLAVLLVGRSLPCDAQARQGPAPGVALDQPGAIHPIRASPGRMPPRPS